MRGGSTRTSELEIFSQCFFRYPIWYRVKKAVTALLISLRIQGTYKGKTDFLEALRFCPCFVFPTGEEKGGRLQKLGTLS
jgi:hypothetical protein